MKHLKYLQICQALAASCLLLIFVIPLVTRADSNYGVSAYGTCSYGSACPSSLTISSSNSLSMSINFTSGNCGSSSDSVVVSTSNSTGYKLFLYSQNASSYLSGPSNISPTTGTVVSPINLASNTWGYRVDGVLNFGTGQTTYARVLATNPGDNIINRTTAYPSGDTTTVQYGVCANTSIPSGSYSDTIIYTAATNP